MHNFYKLQYKIHSTNVRGILHYCTEFTNSMHPDENSGCKGVEVIQDDRGQAVPLLNASVFKIEHTNMISLRI